jgi:hypothetical protein
MKNNKIKIILLSSFALVLALGLVAFVPFSGASQTQQLTKQSDETEPQQPGDHLQALADALGIPVEDLQSAYETAAQTAREQAVNDALEKGLITQERADAMLNGETGPGRHGRFEMGFGGSNLDELVATELGISLEEFQAAQTQVYTDMIEQAVADGEMTQTMADLALARRAASGYFEDAWTSAYQTAVQSALDNGAITQVQADLLLNNMDSGMRGGFGGKPFGGHGGR